MRDKDEEDRLLAIKAHARPVPLLPKLRSTSLTTPGPTAHMLTAFQSSPLSCPTTDSKSSSSSNNNNKNQDEWPLLPLHNRRRHRRSPPPPLPQPPPPPPILQPFPLLGPPAPRPRARTKHLLIMMLGRRRRRRRCRHHNHKPLWQNAIQSSSSSLPPLLPLPTLHPPNPRRLHHTPLLARETAPARCRQRPRRPKGEPGGPQGGTCRFSSTMPARTTAGELDRVTRMERTE